MLRSALGFFPPAAFKALQRLDGVGGVVIHALEDDQAIAGGCNDIPEDFEAIGFIQAHRVQLGFNQGFAGLGQILLNFTDADRPKPFTA